MKKLLFILPAIFSTAFAQMPPVQTLNAQVNPMLNPNDPAVKYANTITENDLKAHLTFLSSDFMEGRETGETGQRITAQYIAAHFMRLGLKPPVKTENGMSYFQHFDLEWLKVESCDMNYGGKEKMKLGENLVVLNKTALENITGAEPVFSGYGIDDPKYNNYKNLDVKGKVVVALSGEPEISSGKYLISGDGSESDWSGDPKMKGEAAASHGATALILILKDADFSDWVSSGWVKRSMTQASMEVVSTNDKGIPVFAIPLKAATSLLKAWKLDPATIFDKLPIDLSTPATKYRVNVTAKLNREIKTSENVLGFLEGTDKKDEIVILTAHMDHIGVNAKGEVYNGADDDGSGTSTVLEMAEAFSKAAQDGIRPRRSILFMPVAGEEKGLLGSEFYSEHPVFPLEKTVVDLNTDMIGRIDEKHEKAGVEDYVYIIGSDKLSTELHTLNEDVNKKYTKIELDYEFNSPTDPNQFYYRSDHYNFAKHNIPVIFFFTGVHKDYHQPGDDIEKIMFPKMTKIAKLIFLDAWEIANREGKLVVDKTNDFKER